LSYGLSSSRTPPHGTGKHGTGKRVSVPTGEVDGDLVSKARIMLEVAETPCDFQIAAPKPYVVRVSVWAPALASQVFQAVVIDEYIEMWTGSRDYPVRCQSEPRLGGRLRLDAFGLDGNPITVDGVFTHFEPERMVACTVSEASTPQEPHCLVFAVDPEFEGARVRLLHMALGSSDDSPHIARLWEAALTRLASLFAALSQNSRDRSEATSSDQPCAHGQISPCAERSVLQLLQR